MTEEQNMGINAEAAPAGYYKDRGAKVTDFFIGFLGYPLVMAFQGLFPLNREAGVVFSVLYSLAVTIGFFVFAHRTGRKYIAIGLGSVFILPLLVMGSCLLIMVAVK